MMNIAVSNCLLGARCRFDALSKTYPGLIELLNEHVVVPICPEEEGGLGCPRPPSEIDVVHGGERVINAEGSDVTIEFREGSRLCVERAVEAGCTLAVLKSKSPACGVGEVYDGTFSGALVRGFGMAARAFCAAGIRVIDEKSFVRCLLRSRALREGIPPLVSERPEQRPVLHVRGADLTPLSFQDCALLRDGLSRASSFATCWPKESSVCRIHAFGVRSTASRASMSGAVALGFDASGGCGDECLLRMRFSASVPYEAACSALHESLRYAFEELGYKSAVTETLFFDESAQAVLHRAGFERSGECGSCSDASSDGREKEGRVAWRVSSGILR